MTTLEGFEQEQTGNGDRESSLCCLSLLRFNFLRKKNLLNRLILAAGGDILSQTKPSETVPVFVRSAKEL